MNPRVTTAPAAGSIARRVSLLALAMLAVVLIGVSALMAVVAEDRSRDRIVLWAGDKAQAVADSADAFDTTARQLTERTYRPFREKFPATLELDVAAQQLRTGAGTDTAAINGDFALVDAFHRDTGGVATVFMRQGDDFKRITTSLKKENGERALGTLLARDHPAYPLMLDGKSYTGRAHLFGQHYMTHYEAVKNSAGQVVGVLVIGLDISDFQAALNKLVAEARFYEHGGTYLIDPRQTNAEAVFVAHPSAAGKKVLEAFPEAGPLLDQLRTGGAGFVAGGPALFDAQATQPWRVMRQAQAGGWWVVSELSDDEAMATHWATIYAFWALLGLTAVILGVGMYVLVRRQVSAPLGELTAAVTSVAQGDLSQAFRSERRDEVGRLVHEVEGMRQRFVGMMRELRTAADGINTASSEIASGNQDLSARTEQAASNLEQTAASMEQLTSTVRNSADAARQANQLASSASAVAVRGGEVVSQVVATMQEIHRSSQRIGDIIGTIDGIAFQTNILALNAAVEAARAGEQGRGFAVVAGEVRNLAQRSAEAAKEIKQLIGASVDKVDAGSRLVADAGQTMSEVVGSIQRVCDIVGEITAASSEQSSGIGQVNVAVNQLDQMTQQNAALVEQSAAAAESLRDQAQRLVQVVQVFRLDGSAPAGFTKPSGPQQVEGTALVAPSPAQAPIARPCPTPPTRTPSAQSRAPAAVTPVAKAAPVSASAEGDWESF